ncbi:M23 family metallopeptidase [Pseudidiomarina sp.]|uniref:M23 family metallopeptidase n=1 Tax=Pseudidiomarina sp. TaxID=2081707 RepID=UPI00299E3B5F|nr:M23 family metallopeptidase [Pseudidiomarina sp.]MDX1706498.1 M23 family metallopeptidase [Pseudidiomarina sp.]
MRKTAWLAALYAAFIIFSPAAAAGAESIIRFSGAFTPGALIIGTTAINNRVSLEGEPLKVTPAGQVVFGFGRDAEGSKTIQVQTPAGEVHEVVIELAPRSYAIDRVDGVPQKTVTPDPAQVARARAEAAKVWQARQVFSAREDFLQPVIKPAEGRISGVYGSQRIFNGQPRNPHFGLDIAAPTGTPVKAPWPGIVVLAEPDLFYSGGTLIIDHGYGVTSTYIHLHKLHVAPGDEIAQGDVIAEIGATGRVTGPHLDWRINWQQERLDPALVLEHFSSSELTTP